MDLSGFEDERSRILTYYVKIWGNEHRCHRHTLLNLYQWLITEKPSLDEYPISVVETLLRFIELFGTHRVGDGMGTAHLLDIQYELKARVRQQTKSKT